MAKYLGLPLSNHKPDNSFAMKTGHLEILLTEQEKGIDRQSSMRYTLKQ